MTTYEEFSIIELRPSIYKNMEVVIHVEIDKICLYRAGINETRACNLTVGDTAYCYVRFVFENEKKGFSTIHMDNALLSEFISKYGINATNVSFKARLEKLYAVYSSGIDVFVNDAEISTYKLLEILD